VRGRRFPLALIGVLALAACATLADLDTDGPSGSGSSGTAPAEDAGSLKPTAEGLVISPEVLSITAGCGAAAEKPLSIHNGGKEKVAWEVSVDEKSIVQLKDADGALVRNVSGTVAPGGVAHIPVTVTASTPGTMPGGEIVIKTKSSTRQMRSEITINGGGLTVTPGLIDFGEVRENRATLPQEVEIENTGNEAVNVRSFSQVGDAGSDFTMSSGSVFIQPGQKGKTKATFNAGPAGEQLSAEFKPETEKPLCGAAPVLSLKGKHVSYAVTINPGGVDFGAVDCNSAPAVTKSVIASNFDPETAHVAFTNSASFTVAPLEQDLAGTTGTATFVIQPRAVGANIVDIVEDIPVAITRLGETTNRSVNARLTVVGATLSIFPTTLGGFKTSEGQSFSLQNTGNRNIRVSHTSSNAAFTVSSGTTANADAFFPSFVGVNLVAAGPHSAQITTTRESGAVLCRPAAVVTVTTQ
jgi:hypothetical protein